MMFGRPDTPTHILAPVGRIKDRKDLQDLVIEARKEKKVIRIYLVQQSGYINEFFITSKSRLLKPTAGPGELCSGEGFHCLNGMLKSSFGSRKHVKDRYFKDNLLTGSFNIGGTDYRHHHYAFTNRNLAEQYSEILKTDPMYTKYVKEWHAYCNKTFSSLEM